MERIPHAQKIKGAGWSQMFFACRQAYTYTGPNHFCTYIFK